MKVAERALIDSNETTRKQATELEVIYRHAPIGIGVYDRNLRFLRVNDALAKFHNVSPADHIGRRVEEVSPEFGEQIGKYLRQVIASGEPVLNVEKRRVAPGHPDIEREFLASYYPLLREDGEVFAVCSVVVEVSERKRAEEAMRFSEARNRDLVKHAVYGIFHAAADGTFLDANPALLSILGCNQLEDLQALNLVRDVYRFPEQFLQHVADCSSRGFVHRAETEWRRRDGGIVTVRLHLRHISLPGEPDTMEIITEDVTELRAMEQQLRQAQKFEAIGQLTGGVAHDFNNVVGAILGWAELGLEENQGRTKASERFARIKEQAERAAALTRELLAFSRRQILQRQAIDLNTVTSGLISFLDKVISKNIELKVVTAPLEAVKADSTQIEQVLMNLCLNARDAMPNGGRMVVETEMVELDEAYARFYPGVGIGRYAVLSVSDTGMGMDAETRERIFEPFFTTKEKGKGTGMGLATVYGIVQQHGGFIHVYSEPGQGSLFRVYLPVLGGEVAKGSPVKVPAASVGELRGTETILIAEDHESIREMARQTLVSLGYHVLSAADGEEALRLCAEDTPAIAILDVVMPKLGGVATAQKLTANFRGLPVVFTSGYSQDSENVGAAAANAHYLQKPYSPMALGRQVREILDQVRGGKPAKADSSQ